MRQRSYGRDTGLTLRMAFTMFMLAGVWVAFMGLLFWAGISPILILGFALIGVALQYFMSDKLVLMSTGAREVSPQEEPWLHATVERLAQIFLYTTLLGAAHHLPEEALKLEKELYRMKRAAESADE